MDNPFGDPPYDPEAPFWRHVIWQGPDACAIYDGPGSRGRWGHVRVSYEGRRIFAPRLAWQLMGMGEIANLLCHVCPAPQPACVAVWAGHLVDGDHKLNAEHRDRLHNSRTPKLPLGEFAPVSKLTARDVEALHRARALEVPVKVLAEVFAVSQGTIYNALSGRHHSVHKPYGLPGEAAS